MSQFTTGTAANPSKDVVTVGGIAGTTPIAVSISSATSSVDTELPAAAALADAQALANTTKVGAIGLQYNSLSTGGTTEFRRGNVDVTVFASAVRTATPTPFDGTNFNGRGLHLVIDCTSVTDTPSVVFTIQALDAVSGKYYTILASAAITGTGTTILRVFPGGTAAANLVANDILPRSWRVIATHADADSITYSVGASVIL